MKIIAMVLAGGEGTRLRPLTAEHAKPALSNLVNSKISRIYVLGQYKPHSLISHIRTAWAPWSEGVRPAIDVVVPEAGSADGSYKGTADAVYRNLHLIEREQPDLVAVFAADHVYRMDVRQMAGFHRERGAQVSIAAVPVPVEKASAFGVMTTAFTGELLDFQEKPARPAPTAAAAGHAYASMGNYLFDPPLLRELLEEARMRGDTDFGHHILPRLPHRHRAFAYDFASNRIPGIQPYEERCYWRDIGTLDAYRAAQRDVQGPFPRFNLSNDRWPIRGHADRGQQSLLQSAALVSAMAPLVEMRAQVAITD